MVEAVKRSTIKALKTIINMSNPFTIEGAFNTSLVALLRLADPLKLNSEKVLRIIE